MLTAAEEDRLEAAVVPDEPVDVSYGGAEAAYELETFWTGGDAAEDDASRPGDYPCVVFDFETEGEPDSDRQPLDNLDRVEEDEEESEYREIKMRALTSELTIQVAVKRNGRDGIDPEIRLKQVARPVWDACVEDLDDQGVLNQEGPDGQRPMKVDVTSGVTTAPVAGTLRAQWSITLSYRTEHTIVHESMETAEHTSDLEIQ